MCVDTHIFLVEHIEFHEYIYLVLFGSTRCVLLFFFLPKFIWSGLRRKYTARKLLNWAQFSSEKLFQEHIHFGLGFVFFSLVCWAVLHSIGNRFRADCWCVKSELANRKRIINTYEKRNNNKNIRNKNEKSCLVAILVESFEIVYPIGYFCCCCCCSCCDCCCRCCCYCCWYPILSVNEPQKTTVGLQRMWHSRQRLLGTRANRRSFVQQSNTVDTITSQNDNRLGPNCIGSILDDRWRYDK